MLLCTTCLSVLWRAKLISGNLVYRSKSKLYKELNPQTFTAGLLIVKQQQCVLNELNVNSITQLLKMFNNRCGNVTETWLSYRVKTKT